MENKVKKNKINKAIVISLIMLVSAVWTGFNARNDYPQLFFTWITLSIFVLSATAGLISVTLICASAFYRYIQTETDGKERFVYGLKTALTYILLFAAVTGTGCLIIALMSRGTQLSGALTELISKALPVHTEQSGILIALVLCLHMIIASLQTAMKSYVSVLIGNRTEHPVMTAVIVFILITAVLGFILRVPAEIRISTMFISAAVNALCCIGFGLAILLMK